VDLKIWWEPWGPVMGRERNWGLQECVLSRHVAVRGNGMPGRASYRENLDGFRDVDLSRECREKTVAYLKLPKAT